MSLAGRRHRHPDRSSVIPLHRSGFNDPDRNVITTDRDVRKPTEKDQVNTQVVKMRPGGAAKRMN
jgi:hypothetical protein